MATGAVSANRLEILQIANAVAAEKSIDKRIVLEAMEEAIQKAARSRYGLEHDIRAEINPDSGETRLWRVQTIVETVENPVTQLTLAEAKKMDSDAEIGNEFREELPPFEFGRVAAQTAKQVITGKVREAERAPPVQRLQGPRRRDHQRHREARRIRPRDRRPRQGRRRHPPQ